MVTDNAAEYHMVNDKNKLVDLEHVELLFNIKGIDSNSSLISNDYCSMYVQLENSFSKEHHIHLSCVLYVPNLSVDLSAIPRLFEDNKFSYNTQKNYAYIYKVDTREIVATGKSVDNLKWIRYSFSKQVAAYPSTVLRNVTPKIENVFMIWHQKLDHMSTKYMKRLEKIADGVSSFKELDLSFFNTCQVCNEGKVCSRSYNNQHSRPNWKFQMLSSDVFDSKAVSFDHKKLIVSITDIYSGFLKTQKISHRFKIVTIFANYYK